MESPALQLNNKRTINGWALFDWANSAYALVISVAIFPAYFRSVTPDIIEVFGMQVTNTGIFAFSVSASYIILAVLSPILSGIADNSNRRLGFLKVFTYIGSLACLSMFFFLGELPMAWLSGITSFVLATIGFAGGLVFYNSFLPQIATKDHYDRVSAKGFAFGYVGSVLLLISNLVILLKPELFGIENPTLPARISFIMVGLWWFGFAQIAFSRLPKDQNQKKLDKNSISLGYQEITKVFQRVKEKKNLRRFLASFFFYSSGVQTVLYLASLFADKELKFDATELIILILILQLVAIVGAYFFAFISRLKGNKFALICMLLIWVTVTLLAYYVTDKGAFYGLSAGVGMVMGGIQAISRSSYSKLIPTQTKDRASYFSFYDILEKLAIVFGSFSFGLIEQLTGGMRNSVLVLSLYFIIGLIILLGVNFKKTGNSTIVAT